MNLANVITMSNRLQNHNSTQEITHSKLVLDYSVKINIFATILAIIIGSFGNILTIFVYSRKKFRINSSNVYLFCLAINNGLFLIVHFFEDILRAYKQVFISNETLTTTAFSDFINLINITDKFEYACRSVNYLRYVLRFISAYIIVAFTVQRLILVFSPLFHKLRYKRSAWISVVFIVISSLLVNLWVPFLFEIQSENYVEYCDMKKVWHKEYFRITILYITIIMVIPGLIILASNLIIIMGTYKSDKNQDDSKMAKRFSQIEDPFRRNKKSMWSSNKLAHQCRPSIRRSRMSFKFKQTYLSTNQIAAKISGKTNSAKKLTKMLLFISFSYVVLNLPYLVTWLLFFYEVAFKGRDDAMRNYLFAAVQIAEIFYVLNYGLLFYLFSASGLIFKNGIANPASYLNIKMQLLD